MLLKFANREWRPLGVLDLRVGRDLGLVTLQLVHPLSGFGLLGVLLSVVVVEVRTNGAVRGSPRVVVVVTIPNVRKRGSLLQDQLLCLTMLSPVMNRLPSAADR